MQLLRGSTLQTVLDRTETADLSVARAAAVAAQIAAVLVDVHRVDVVHRDIKPANIVVTDSGLVKVLDFGIAILRGQGALPRLTQVDRTVGTPAYVSPEQHLGQPVTAASDVYSLGCVLCELLTGDPPFFDSTDMPLRARHLQTPPPSVRERVVDVPVELDALVRSMLAKDPSARPTAEQVYSALEPWRALGAGDEEQDPDEAVPATALAAPPGRSAAHPWRRPIDRGRGRRPVRTGDGCRAERSRARGGPWRRGRRRAGRRRAVRRDTTPSLLRRRPVRRR